MRPTMSQVAVAHLREVIVLELHQDLLNNTLVKLKLEPLSLVELQ